MKSLSYVIVLTALLTSLTTFADQNDGIDRGNGGDEISQSFVDLGYEVVESLMKDPIAGVDTNALYRAVEATKVNSEETLELRGYPVDAINYPDPQKPRILVSRSGWTRMESAPHKRVFLAFHEYLGIMGVDDSNYQISSRLDRAKVCDRNPNVKAEIEKDLKKSCYRIIPDDLQYVSQVRVVENAIDRLSQKDFAGLNPVGLSIARNRLREIDLSTLAKMNKLTFLGLGSSVPELADCSFLRNKPNLNFLSLSDSENMGGPSKFRAIQKISRGCLSHLAEAPQFLGAELSLDGQASQYRGFLEGLPALKSLQIDGIHLNEIPVGEFAFTKMRSLTFTAYDGRLPSASQMAEVTGLACTASRDFDDKETFKLSCTPRFQ